MTENGIFSRSSSSPRHRHCALAILLLMLAGLMLVAWPSLASPPEFQIDPSTGNAVAQLTTTDLHSEVFGQDNYALYYHQNSQAENGQFLVYRYLECTCDGSGCQYWGGSLEYRRLDLETGEETLMAGRGLANNAVVHGSHLYIGKRDVAGGPYQRLERVELDDPGAGAECLTPLPTGHNLAGALTVNADGTVVVYQTFLSGQPEKGFFTWAHFIDPAASSTCPTSHADLELHPVEPGIEHLHFSPTDPTTFTFIDQKETSLTRLGIGTVTATGSTWNSLASSSGYLGSFGGYPHPFWDADGHLWSDAIDPDTSASAEAFIRLDLDEALGWVDSYASVEMTSADWHHHQGGGRSLGWFVGDGLNIESRAGYGEPYISLFHLDPPPDRIGGSLVRHRLADSLEAEHSGRGNYGANAHLLETLDGVVFAAPFDFDSGGGGYECGCPDSRNIFLVKIPPPLRAELRDTVTLGGADGPFKHAGRVAVSADGQSWTIDYGRGGSTPSIGDGAADRTAGAIAPTSGPVGLADIDGDGVDDRLAFSAIATGGWTVDLAYSPYDGVLPEVDVSADVSRNYDGPWTLPPVFGDLDGDGRDDLILLDNSGADVLWQGRFSVDSDLPAVPYVNLGLPWEVAAPYGDPSQDVHFFAADVNGDGYADRITVRPDGAWWRWALDLGTSSGFGDGVDDATYVGASNATDIPLMVDVTLDGRADIVIARQHGEQWRWYVNPSSGDGFGNAWDPPVGRGFFGASGEQPLIGIFGRFHTVQP